EMHLRGSLANSMPDQTLEKPAQRGRARSFRDPAFLIDLFFQLFGAFPYHVSEFGLQCLLVKDQSGLDALGTSQPLGDLKAVLLIQKTCMLYALRIEHG